MDCLLTDMETMGTTICVTPNTECIYVWSLSVLNIPH